uniref:FERM and PDZ domain-containing protein 1 isoform X2 n=1 Tax=Doryrhamphus excisus TaxID=161450 RepID=UPI0025ADBA2F|nr:FERM and PDZ domain-containing protein 1 isoform X2 [Doryrhamphus excisus]
MELQDRSYSPSRRTSRVEQVVGRWLRRSRELGSRSLSRDRIAIDGTTAECSTSDQRNSPFRLNVLIQQDPNFRSHGLTLSSHTPILVEAVTPGGPADGRLVPGDQLLKINNVTVDDLTSEQAAEIIRECEDALSVTILRTMLGPKSSFITPEKRAKLKSNPVKVRFAEEVEVNGHAQGNSLLFLPNVLKVYLENGQTKAFKFEPSTTVKDIVMTLKEKLSLRNIEHFSLVLEQQYSVTKLLLLHDEEKIQEVVQKKESHDFRCLFRVCFVPKQPETLLQGDPTAFEYFYLQGVNDVLQERFAVEMRCNTALRLAALHIQERLVSCGLPPKTSLKTVIKTWGMETFVSSTLLRNMREKDMKKAITFQLKKSQSQNDSKQKGLTVELARLNYLEELSELKSFGGKSFSATMMLQDRESTVTLLVGARYGVSQVINHKMSILSTLTEFNSITRLELIQESDKVSLVKIYLQDIKPMTLLLETLAAKDMSCLIAGYCRVFVDPAMNIFPWMDAPKKHKVSVEEGYVSRCGSDSDNSSDLDMEPLVSRQSRDGKRCPRVRSSSGPEGRRRPERNPEINKHARESRSRKDENDADAEKDPTDTIEESKKEDKQETGNQNGGRLRIHATDEDCEKPENEPQEPKTASAVTEDQPCLSDSCHTDSCVITSPSSDSLDFLEEDDLILCSCASLHPSASTPSHAQTYSTLELHPYTHTYSEGHLLAPPPAHSHRLLHVTSYSDDGGAKMCGDGAEPQRSFDIHLTNYSTSSYSESDNTCFAELSCLVDLPSPPEASEDEEDDVRKRTTALTDHTDEALTRLCDGGNSSFCRHPHSPSSTSASSHSDFVFNFDQSDARCYYKLCSNITPDSARSLSRPGSRTQRGEDPEQEHAPARDLRPLPILQPPPGFGDSSSDEEFFDARDRLTSPDDPGSGAGPKDGAEMKAGFLSDMTISTPDSKKEVSQRGNKEGGGGKALYDNRKRSRLRRSFKETDGASYPDPHSASTQDPVRSKSSKNHLAEAIDAHTLTSDPEPSEQTQNPSPTVSSLTHSEGEPAQLETKPILIAYGLGSSGQARDPLAPTRKRKQDMEMEPDAMESKSVNDIIKTRSPSITVVRCRVDPDGWESADRRADGKEELGNQDQNNKSAPVQKYDDAMPSSSYSPPPPPPSSPLLPVPVAHHSTGTSSCEEEENALKNPQLLTSDEGEGTGVVCSGRTPSDEVADGANSDNVFDDDDAINALGGKDDRTTVMNCSPRPEHTATDGGTKRNAHPEHTLAANAITASSDELKSDVLNNSCETQTVHKAKGESTSGADSLPANTTVVHNLAKGSPSPTHFLFQSCSPNVMGRLSASTLREKIQKLPMFLSHSQESLNQDGQCSANTDIMHTAMDVHDVMRIRDTLQAEESDDSDTTVTGSEVEDRFSVLPSPASKSDLGSEVRETPGMLEDDRTVRAEPQRQQQLESNKAPGPITQPPVSIALTPARHSTIPTVDTPGPVKDAPRSQMNDTRLPSVPPAIVVTTQNLNGPGLHFHGQSQKDQSSIDRPLISPPIPPEPNTDPWNPLSSGCLVFEVCEDPSHSGVSSEGGTTLSWKPALASRCEGLNTDACGCPAVYTNCFSGGGSFDEEMTVYEFSCQGSGEPPSSRLALPLTTDPSGPPSFLTSPTSELSPLLSPLSDVCMNCKTQKDTINRLGKQRYPKPPAGFHVLRVDVNQLLSVLEKSAADRSAAGQGGRHPRDTCASHFTENNQVLQTEARRLTTSCQKVVGIEQNPEEMLNLLADSFRTLVELAGVCIWFSGCDRCERRNAEAVSSLADVARSFKDLCLAAERAGGNRTCHDLSTKLLAKQCTALTASVFCLTQVFRTLTAL